MTDKALARIRSAMAKENISPAEGGLRLGVQGGGCSGLSYNIRFDTQPRERDRVFQYDDVRVFVDPKSFIYLHGMILDYEETLMHQGFVFQEPECEEVVRLRQLVLVSLGCDASTHPSQSCGRRAAPWNGARDGLVGTEFGQLPPD